ncbi:MAG: DUF2809 domain-containing protein [Microcoleaceae cyanobacterium]
MHVSRYRLDLLLGLFGSIVLGLASKFYNGPLENWVNDSFSSIFYEMCWAFLVAFVWPALTLIQIAVGVFVLTCGLEILQLWHPPFLEAIRATLLGRLILGTTFVATDFLYYGVGCVVAGLCLYRLKR